jgi:hypothetical protein
MPNSAQSLYRTVLIHASLDTFAQSASSALVAVRLVHHAAALRLGFADILPLPPDGPLEEPGTAATGHTMQLHVQVETTAVKQKHSG